MQRNKNGLYKLDIQNFPSYVVRQIVQNCMCAKRVFPATPAWFTRPPGVFGILFNDVGDYIAL